MARAAPGDSPFSGPLPLGGAAYGADRRRRAMDAGHRGVSTDDSANSRPHRGHPRNLPAHARRARGAGWCRISSPTQRSAWAAAPTWATTSSTRPRLGQSVINTGVVGQKLTFFIRIKNDGDRLATASRSSARASSTTATGCATTTPRTTTSPARSTWAPSPRPCWTPGRAST